MARSAQVVGFSRYWMGRITYPMLCQYDVVVVIDTTIDVDPTKGSRFWKQQELDAFREYHHTGHGIGVLCHSFKETSGLLTGAHPDHATMANALLTKDDLTGPGPVFGLKVSLGIDLTGNAEEANVPKQVRKSGSTKPTEDAAIDANLAISGDADYYTVDTHIRHLNGPTRKAGRLKDNDGIVGTFVVDNVYTLGALSDFSDALEEGGEWKSLIVRSKHTDIRDIRHLAYTPPGDVLTAASLPAAATGLEGIVELGRVLLDLNHYNFRTDSSTYTRTDQIRMLASALTWLNRGQIPRKVLLYFTVDRPDQRGGKGDEIWSPHAPGTNRAFGFLAQNLEMMLSLDPASYGEPAT